MSVIGEAALSPFLDLLFEKLVSSALNFVADHKELHNQLKEWQSKLPYIQAVLNDAKEKQIKHEGVKKWLADLQDLAYDVDDILDEFSYEALRLKLQNNQAQASNSKVRKLIPTCCSSCYLTPTSFMFNNKMISKIKVITRRLNELTTISNGLGLSKIVSEGANSKAKKPRLQPTPVMDEAVGYVGRENEKREILELLKSGNAGCEDGVSVIPIVAMGGMGKTTLAQLVYNDASINDYFDLKAWVCVSDDFNAINTTKTILRSIDPESPVENELAMLQVKLKEKLLDKKFLLVLDDIWNESYNDWTILRSPFGVGTKIIVTTRLQTVSSNVVTLKDFHLRKLSDDDCLSIFTQHALGVRDFSRDLEFKEVGEKIVRRCDGLPLAAKAIGGLLRTIRDRGAWDEISMSKIWDLPEDRCGIIPALLLSYHHLPSHLKRCFAYCSILPKDYEFEEEEVILLWRAEGFLQQRAKSQIKDFGNECFQDLVSRSFFQLSSKDSSRYVMHDLMNDLAQLVAGEICSKLEGEKQQKIPYRTRHASYVSSEYDRVKKFEAFDQVNSLRSFLPLKLLYTGSFYLTSFVLDDLLPRLNCLRVLSLNGYCISELPDIFENLKHLRLLDFSNNNLIKCLPDSLCTLYHLETLKLRECRNLEKLPSELGNLKELYYVDISGCSSIKEMPLGVGKLTNLQRLSNFIIGEDDGQQIRELRNLSKLRGDFCLSGLENVESQDARDAKLDEKWGIDRLMLEWSRCYFDKERVLDFLRPQEKLKQLIIKNYGGAKFSAWIADSSFKNLLSLELRDCGYCKSLPSIGRLPVLKDLLLCGLYEVNKVGVEFFGENQLNAFATLETLRFEYMPNWKEWDPCEADEQVSKFPSLRELYIFNCPELLGRLPTRLHSLQKLEIKKCSRLVVSISIFPRLRELTIEGCEELVDTCSASEEVHPLQKVSLIEISKFSIPSERIMSGFRNSKDIEIGGWMELASLSQTGLGLIGHRFITIKNCPQLVSLETEEEEKLQLGKITGVESLTIEHCERLNRLPKVLYALAFLGEMKITECPSLVCFAESKLPATLKRLKIVRCQNLKYLVDERESKSMISNSCFLEDLEIRECSTLTCLFLNAELPMTLKKLFIWECPELECIAQDFHQTTALQSITLLMCGKIKSLPRGLDKLHHLQLISIQWCSNLVSFEESGLPTTLRYFIIDCCTKFGALPKCMHNFASLRFLTSSRCSADISFPEEGFPINLTSLHITNAPKIYRSLVDWGLNRLTSLQRLIIGGEGCSDVVSFPEKNMMLPASLTSIYIKSFENMEYMCSDAFQNLTSLKTLMIINCSKLRALPEKDMLHSLGLLWIKDCPLLKENCKRDEGREWSKIAHIPHVQIDGMVLEAAKLSYEIIFLPVRKYCPRIPHLEEACSLDLSSICASPALILVLMAYLRAKGTAFPARS
ncbi:hypothetical protein PTKIN_Ptkin14bG0162300 [Pterospermum kingtungense]